MSLAVTCLIGSGCASIQSAYDNFGGAAALVDYSIEELDKAYQKWLAQYEDAGGTIGNDPAEVEEAAPVEEGIDAVAFSELEWKYGGFSGGSAILSEPRISNIKVSSSGMSISWDVKLSSWGLAESDAGALACLFCKVDGAWRGGKFDWISSSRATRDFKNINSGYNGWSASDFNRATAYAFVVVSKDGKRRSNVAYCVK